MPKRFGNHPPPAGGGPFGRGSATQGAPYETAADPALQRSLARNSIGGGRIRWEANIGGMILSLSAVPQTT